MSHVFLDYWQSSPKIPAFLEAKQISVNLASLATQSVLHKLLHTILGVFIAWTILQIWTRLAQSVGLILTQLYELWIAWWIQFHSIIRFRTPIRNSSLSISVSIQFNARDKPTCFEILMLSTSLRGALNSAILLKRVLICLPVHRPLLL